MKNGTAKLDKFYKWCAQSGGVGNDPLYCIPTVRMFKEYQMESEEPIEDLTPFEEEHIQTRMENLLFAQACKGVIKTDVAKLALGNFFAWSERTKPKENEVVDYVMFDTQGMNDEPTANHDGESLENEAIKDLKVK